MSGQNVELENYEKFLMEAYDNYNKAWELAIEMQDESANSNIALRKKTIVSLLETTKEKLNEQSVTLAQYNEDELARLYAQRADNVQKYLNGIDSGEGTGEAVETVEVMDSLGY